ncbi:MAG: hypothetical protein QXP36_00300 [Conexivisphaerales archaeon]|uniref:hypothetical protein n=1 Tax=Saccharolobus sp. TaxID=2100761 RepID=UPI003181CC82
MIVVSNEHFTDEFLTSLSSSKMDFNLIGHCFSFYRDKNIDHLLLKPFNFHLLTQNNPNLISIHIPFSSAAYDISNNMQRVDITEKVKNLGYYIDSHKSDFETGKDQILSVNWNKDPLGWTVVFKKYISPASSIFKPYKEKNITLVEEEMLFKELKNLVSGIILQTYSNFFIKLIGFINSNRFKDI